MGEDTFEVKGLEQLLKALKGKPPVARVGVLGSNSRTTKSNENPTNSEIGAAHEFGSPARGIPQRSFLRIPITEHLQKEMESSGLLTEKEMKEVIKQGSVKPWLEVVAKLGEGISLDSFNTGGFGKWPAWKNPNYHNGGNQLLVDTQQLRDSITSEVVE